MTSSVWEWPAKHRGTINSRFRLSSSALSSMSPYTGEIIPYGPNYQKFVADLSFPTKAASDWRELSGFITRLRGIVGGLRIPDVARCWPGHDVESTPSIQNWSDGKTWSDGRGWESGFLPPFVVAAQAAETGDTSIVLKGFPPSLVAVQRPGDLFEIRPNGIPAEHGMLHEVVVRNNSNTAGQTRVYFEPGLRIGLMAGDMVVIRYPTSVFRLADDNQGSIQRGLANLGTMGLSLVEVLPRPAT